MPRCPWRYVYFINPASKRCHPSVELIGEEIYDEFDTDGARHGDIPPQSVSPGLLLSLKRNGSDPQLSTHPDTLCPAPPTQLTQRSSTVSGTPVQRPIAIPAFKALSFLTGPVPCDGNSGRTLSTRPTTAATIPDTNYEKLKKPEAPVDTADDAEKLPEITTRGYTRYACTSLVTCLYSTPALSALLCPP